MYRESKGTFILLYEVSDYLYGTDDNGIVWKLIFYESV